MPLPQLKKTQEIQQKLQEISGFSKVTVWKINTQKSNIFLYTINKYIETNIKICNIFNCSKIKYTYFAVYVIKNAQDFYTENYKALMKKKIKDLNKCKEIQCQRIGRLNIVKLSTVSKWHTN